MVGEETMNERVGSKTISISVPNDMYKWLEENNGINRSKVFQDAVNKIRFPIQQKMTPLMLLSTVMGMCFSVLLMLIPLAIMRYIGIFASTMMFLVGVLLLFVTVMVVLKVKRNARNAVPG